jgi:hypothetical protein
LLPVVLVAAKALAAAIATSAAPRMPIQTPRFALLVCLIYSLLLLARPCRVSTPCARKATAPVRSDSFQFGGWGDKLFRSQAECQVS